MNVSPPAVIIEPDIPASPQSPSVSDHPPNSFGSPISPPDLSSQHDPHSLMANLYNDFTNSADNSKMPPVTELIIANLRVSNLQSALKCQQNFIDEQNEKITQLEKQLTHSEQRFLSVSSLCNQYQAKSVDLESRLQKAVGFLVELRKEVDQKDEFIRKYIGTSRKPTDPSI
ncbi:hypothetical protein RCL1_001550 [Eukaryota sp. TZLM3-RCL]